MTREIRDIIDEIESAMDDIRDSINSVKSYTYDASRELDTLEESEELLEILSNEREDLEDVIDNSKCWLELCYTTGLDTLEEMKEAYELMNDTNIGMFHTLHCCNVNDNETLVAKLEKADYWTLITRSVENDNFEEVMNLVSSADRLKRENDILKAKLDAISSVFKSLVTD